MINFLKKLFKKKEVKEETYIKYFILDGNLKIEFQYNDIEELIAVADHVLNLKVRDASIALIYETLRKNGQVDSANLFIDSIDTGISPSECVI